MYLPHPATGQLKIKIGLLLCLILLGLVPVCQCWVADWSTSFEGKATRATIKAHSATPHLPRPYGDMPPQGLRACLLLYHGIERLLGL